MQPSELAFSERQMCPDCGTELVSALLCCPGCGALTYREELKRLAAEAQQASTPADALAHWRRALALLPQGSQQHTAILGIIEKLCAEVERSPATHSTAPQPGAKKKNASWLAGLGVIGALLFKFKFAVVFLLTKGKLLLLGLTKASTLLTMFASFGVYWSAWGWKFAAGFVASIYVHEMGHVAALRRLGIQASAPMFIPGLGALVRLKEALPTAVEDARVGLAGPIWGLAAAVVAWGIAWATHSPLWAAIAQTGAWLNLFNLTPIWQLDGSRAFRAMSRTQRGIAAAILLAAFLLTKEGVLMLVLVFAAIRVFGSDAAEKADHKTLGDYAALIALLSALAWWRPV